MGSILVLNEDPTCCGAISPHAAILSPFSASLLKPERLEPMSATREAKAMRSHHITIRLAPTRATRGSPSAARKTSTAPKSLLIIKYERGIKW